MSKKLYSSEKWKRYLKSRQRYQLRRTRERRRRRRGAIPIKRQQSRNLPVVTLAVPGNFSIIRNPADFIMFFRDLRYPVKNNILPLNLTSLPHFPEGGKPAVT